MSSVKKVCISAICMALCCVLPTAFHSVGLGGVFCPMHLPVLLCGLLCGWPYGLVCGVAGPVLSFVASGSPGPSMMVSMVPELCVYGLVTGLGMKLIHTGKTVTDVYASMLPAMLLGRIVGGAAQAAFYLSSAKSYSIAIWASAYFVQTAPGTVVQLVVLPALVLVLGRARLIPARYPKEGVPA